MKEKLGSIILCLFLGQAAFANDFYVNNSWGQDYWSGTKDRPFRTINRGIAAVKDWRGDTVYVAATGKDYWESVYIGPTKDNMRLIGGDGYKKARVQSWEKFAIQISGANKVTVSGFEVTARGEKTWIGIAIKDKSRNITIHDNYVHSSSGSGIAANQSDRITITNNRVSGNAKNTKNYCGSGISLYQLRNLTDWSDATKNIIRGNIVSGNENVYGAPSADGCKYSDGNGIIIDDSRNTQHDGGNVRYYGRTLIENNLVFNNGGRGVHIYLSDRVTVRHNTVYHNNTRSETWRPGEIMAVKSGGVTIANNIAKTNGAYFTSNTGHRAAISVTKGSGEATSVHHNFMYGDYSNGNQSLALFMPKKYEGAHANYNSVYEWSNIRENPYFVKPGTDQWNVDFRAWNKKVYGYGSTQQVAEKDYLNVYRNKSAPSIGAYEKKFF